MMYLLQGLTLGLAYVAPIGVQNLFVINTGLTQSKSRAYKTALIVIFFDITLALICFFGVGLLLDRFELLKKGVLLVGGIVVMLIGAMLLKPEKKAKEAPQDAIEKNVFQDKSILKVIGTACVVTWFNPQAWIDGSLLFGAFRASLPPEKSSLFILGVAMASCIWFLTLTILTTVFKSKFSPKILRMINIICGVVILIYGLKLIGTFLQFYL